MKTLARRLVRSAKKLWSGNVETHYHPPHGLFTESADVIARTLLQQSNSPRQAVARVTFYMNRAGRNLTGKDRGRLKRAIRLIEQRA